MDSRQTPEALRGYREITAEVRSETPSLRTSGLPTPYSPKVAGYTAGPFLDPQLITPSSWRWYNTKTYIIRHSDGLDYRAVLVSSNGEPVGYWAVEKLGTPLPLPGLTSPTESES
jgi:hypothetical protein